LPCTPVPDEQGEEHCPDSVAFMDQHPEFFSV
jgi:hypothetical protein